MRAPSAYTQAGILALLAAFLYLPTIHHPLVFDDHIYLKNNPLFKDFSFFTRILTDFQGVVHSTAKLGLDGDIAANFVLRPVTYLTFWLNHALAGLSPEGYRLLNILIHTLNALAVFDLARLLSKDLLLQHENDPAGSFMPALSSLLFFVHPLQIESVTYLTQRATSLNALFYLSALVCHRRVWTGKIPKGLGIGATLLLGLLAMLSKESGATLPITIVLMDCLIWGIPLQAALRRAWHLIVLLPLVPMLVASVSAVQRGGITLPGLFSVAHGESSQAYGLYYLLTQPSVWLTYLRLFLWPAGQNVDPEVPLLAHFSDLGFWLPLLVLLVPLGTAVALRAHPRLGSWARPVLLAMGWFYLTLSPSLMPLPDAMAEHRVYLSLAGACLGAATLALLLLKKIGLQSESEKIAVPWMVAAITCLLAAVTQQRNRLWASEETLWADACQKSPGKLRPWLNYASALAEGGKVQAAEDAYTRAIQIQPTGIAHANLALLHLRHQNMEKALEISMKALDCTSSGYDFFVLGVIGECLFRSNRWAESIPFFEASLRSTGGYFLSLKLLGIAQLAVQKPSAARSTFERALDYHPGNPELLAGLAEAERQIHATPPPATTTQPGAFKLQLGLGR